MIPSAGLPSILQRVTRMLLVMALLWALLMSAVVRQVVHHEVDELMDQSLRESAEILHSVIAVLHQQGLDQAMAQVHAEYEEHLVWQVVERQTGALVAQSHKAPARALLLTLDAEPRDTPDGLWRVVSFGFQNDPGHFLLVAQSEAERVEARAEAASYTLIATLLMDLLRREMAAEIATDVLIIEDETFIAMDLESLVKNLGHNVIGVARTHSDAVALATNKKPGLILADIQLADGSSGLDAVNELLRTFEVPVVFITAYPERFLTGERPEPAFLISKPFQPAMVSAVASQALFFQRNSRNRTPRAASA